MAIDLKPLIEEMRECTQKHNIEEAHAEADKILCDALSMFGTSSESWKVMHEVSELLRLYDKIEKWHA